MINGKKVVITYGTFDLMHEGHINILKRARKMGDILIVGVTSPQYDLSRGKLNVVQSLEERIENVRSLNIADIIIVEEYDGQKIDDIQKYKVDIFVIGSDWKGKFDYLRRYCDVVYLPRTPGISSTLVRDKKFRIINIGIVGSGRIARRFVTESKFVSGVNVLGVFSPDINHAKKFAEEFELGFFTNNYDELLPRVDAVYIASPHIYHYEQSKKALLSGRHVLCEKPAALRLDHINEILEISKRNNVAFLEAIKTAYSPGFLKIMDIVKRKTIGEVKDIEATFTKIIKPSREYREYNKKLGGGAFNELASYVLLPVVKIFGKPKKTDFFYIKGFNDVDIFTKINLFFDGKSATLKIGIGVKSEGDLVISGTQGYIYVPSPWWKPTEIYIKFEDPSKYKKFSYNYHGDGLRYEIAEFWKVINKNKFESDMLNHENILLITSILDEFNRQRGIFL